MEVGDGVPTLAGDLEGADWDWDDDEPSCPVQGIESLSGLDPRQAVGDWSITAAGSKPEYHLARDCLYASLFRSRLPTWFHTYVKRPPPWITDLTEHLSPREQDVAVRHIALHYQHLRRLALVSQADVLSRAHHGWNGFDTDSILRMLPRLWRCWPYGVGVTWRGEGERTERDVCDLGRLCPWCFARRVVKLHLDILGGPLRNSRDRYLLQGRALVLHENPDPVEWVWSGQGARTVRERFGPLLLAQARRLGVEGGILTFQVGMDWSPHERLPQYELGILGEVSPEAVGKLRRNFECRLDRSYSQAGGARAALGTELETMWPVFDTSLGDPDEYHPVCWTLLPARPRGDQDAARLLLAGTSTSYPLAENLGLYTEGVSDLSPHFQLDAGLPGVLGYQPTFLLREEEWVAYAAMTWGLPLYRSFGTWQGRLGSKHEATSGTDQAPPYRSGRALSDGSGVGFQIGQGQETELLEVARLSWPEVLARCDGKRGRPPHRTVLGQVLREKGITVSERSLRLLVKALRPSGQNQDG